MFIGFGLLFPAVVLTQVLWDLLLAARTNINVMFPLPAVALIVGGGAWLVIFVFCSPPLRSYILAHELTHALWGMLMGARVGRIRVKADHGSVTLSKTNFLITLAPYFFPLYTCVVLLVYGVLYLFLDVQPYTLFWLGLIGFTWTFHVTFTINALLQRQTDIEQQGRIFSYAFVYVTNVLGICIWVLFVTKPDWQDLQSMLAERTTQAWSLLEILFLRLRRMLLDTL